MEQAALEYWNLYLKTLPEAEWPTDAFVESGPAGNYEITDELVDLYEAGKKSAGSSPKEDFLVTGDRMPAVGDYWILEDSQKSPRMILKTIRTEENNFARIPESIVLAEGEGDLSVAHWKKVHSDLYQPYLQKWGVKSVDEITIITEFFEIVHR